MAEDRFGTMDVSVTLTGEEWCALLARITGVALSPKGSRRYRAAAKKMQKQLLEVIERSKKEPAQ